MLNNHNIAPLPGNYNPYHPNVGYQTPPEGTTEAEKLKAHLEYSAKSAIHRAVDRQGHRGPMQSFKLATLATAAKITGKPLTQPEIDAVLEACSNIGRELSAVEVEYVLKTL